MLAVGTSAVNTGAVGHTELNRLEGALGRLGPRRPAQNSRRLQWRSPSRIGATMQMHWRIAQAGTEP